jgi:methylamine---glutamate N-methyltransferase subunit C
VQQPKPEHTQREESASFNRTIIDYIQHAAASGLYEIRGLGAKRRLPHFDDLVFLGASVSRYPLECWVPVSLAGPSSSPFRSPSPA